MASDTRTGGETTGQRHGCSGDYRSAQDSNISRMRGAGIAADVVAVWRGHNERMTQAV